MSYEKNKVDLIVVDVKRTLEELRKPIMSEGPKMLALCEQCRKEVPRSEPGWLDKLCGRCRGKLRKHIEANRLPQESDWLQNHCDRQRLERECAEWVARWSSAQYDADLQRQIDRLHGCLRILQNVKSPNAVDTTDLEALGGPDFATVYQPPDADTVAAWEAAIEHAKVDPTVKRKNSRGANARRLLIALRRSQGIPFKDLEGQHPGRNISRDKDEGLDLGRKLRLPELPVSLGS